MQKPTNILIVDDEKDIEILFRQQFRKDIKTGRIDFQFAFSGEEAIVALSSKQPPEVVYVFSDINMPGMSGLDLLKKIKVEFPDIKVSLISAYGNSEYQAQAEAHGAEALFTKPIDFKALRQKIDHVVLEN